MRWVMLKELLGLPGMPSSISTITRHAKKMGWTARRRSGVQGVAYEYLITSLPIETQFKLIERDPALVSDPPPSKLLKREKLLSFDQCPPLLERELASLTDKQKTIADARATLCQEVDKLRIHTGMGRNAAIHAIVDGCRSGILSDRVLDAAATANARLGNRRGIGKSRLQEWYSIYQLTAKDSAKRLAALSPKKNVGKPPETLPWLPLFMQFWRTTSGSDITYCYKRFKKAYQLYFTDTPPAYAAVCRILKKLPKRERLHGRVTGSAARALEIYSKRDWDDMPINGCWICDGTSMDMRVRHPISGTAFVPELTLVLDGRSRVVVGWSLSYSENTLGVSEAYRYAMERYGKPLFVYSDNGAGQKNKVLDQDVTGIFPRLGIEHITGIPGNPQARGIIERLNRVIPYRVSQRFPTCYGPTVDRETVRKRTRDIQAAEHAVKQGKPLDKRKREALALVPEWEDLIAAIQEEVDIYNRDHAHSELRVGRHCFSPLDYREKVLQEEGDDIEYLTAIELRQLFMPEEIRTVHRGWIELDSNSYFSMALARYDGEKVRVGYDTRDIKEVIIREMDGVYICNAVWNGNTRSAIPKNRMEKALEQRATRKIKALENKIQLAKQEITPAIEHKPDLGLFSGDIPFREVEKVDFSQLSKAKESEHKKEREITEDDWCFFQYEYDQRQKKKLSNG